MFLTEATARRERDHSARMRLQEEYDEEKKGEKDYEDFLRIFILNYL